MDKLKIDLADLIRAAATQRQISVTDIMEIHEEQVEDEDLMDYIPREEVVHFVEVFSLIEPFITALSPELLDDLKTQLGIPGVDS